MDIIINANEDPIKTKHVAYFIQDSLDGKNIELHQVYEATYIRSDIDDPTTISKLETWIINSYNKNSIQATPLLLLKLALDNITLTQ